MRGSFTLDSPAKTCVQHVLAGEIMYRLFQRYVVFLVIAKQYLYGTVKTIAISNNIDNMALFLFTFFHANILFYEISLDWIAIFHDRFGLRMFFILLILLEGDLGTYFLSLPRLSACF
jgi:hypothetical protein